MLTSLEQTQATNSYSFFGFFPNAGLHWHIFVPNPNQDSSKAGCLVLGFAPRCSTTNLNMLLPFLDGSSPEDCFVSLGISGTQSFLDWLLQDNLLRGAIQVQGSAASPPNQVSSRATHPTYWAKLPTAGKPSEPLVFCHELRCPWLIVS